jgi:hypothetical protein
MVSSSLARAVLIAVCSALVAVTGASAEPSITGKAFAKRADAICADYRSRVSHVPRTAVTDMPGTYRLAVAVLAIARIEAAKLKTLALPSHNRALARSWLATWDPRLIDLLTKLRDAAQRKDARAVRVLAAALDANGATGRRLAALLGMKVCSRAA